MLFLAVSTVTLVSSWLLGVQRVEEQQFLSMSRNVQRKNQKHSMSHFTFLVYKETSHSVVHLELIRSFYPSFCIFWGSYLICAVDHCVFWRSLHVYRGFTHAARPFGKAAYGWATGISGHPVFDLLLSHVWLWHGPARCPPAEWGHGSCQVAMETERRAQHILDEGLGGLRVWQQTQSEGCTIICTLFAYSNKIHELLKHKDQV